MYTSTFSKKNLKFWKYDSSVYLTQTYKKQNCNEFIIERKNKEKDTWWITQYVLPCLVILNIIFN